MSITGGVGGRSHAISAIQQHGQAGVMIQQQGQEGVTTQQQSQIDVTVQQQGLAGVIIQQERNDATINHTYDQTHGRFPSQGNSTFNIFGSVNLHRFYLDENGPSIQEPRPIQRDNNHHNSILLFPKFIHVIRLICVMSSVAGIFIFDLHF